ncbi:hypothetical protein Tco_0556046, partial [Tanacetum coccineum]
LGDQEDASKHGRNIAKLDQDEEISFVQEDAETQGRYGNNFEVNTISAPITTTGVSVSTAEPSTPPTTTVIEDEDITIAQTLTKMRSEKSKEKAKERGSKEKSSELATRPTRGVTMQENSESGTRRVVPPSQHDLKDKGKAKMIKPEKPSKKKDQIKFNEEVAKRFAEELEVELEEEERVTIQREEEANSISWDNTQAMMEADYELAQRLQAEEQGELTIEERLVKDRFEITSPEGYDRLLWGDLITLFEPSEEDEIWKAQQYYTLISWRLYDSCGVHVLLMDTRITIHMMVEKKYPLRPEMLATMLSRKLEVNLGSTQKLIGNNFMEWYHNLRIVLSTEDKLPFLEQPIPTLPVPPEGQANPPDVVTTHQAWVKAQKEITRLMLMAIDLNI